MSFYNGILNLTNWSANVILPTLAATSAIGFIVAARAISISDLTVTGLVPPKALSWPSRRIAPSTRPQLTPRRYWRFERRAQVSTFCQT